MLNNCPFEIYGKNVDGKWRFVVKVPNHNHPASPPEAHPMHECLDETQFESVIALTQAGTRHSRVLSSLLQQDQILQLLHKIFPMLKQ